MTTPAGAASPAPVGSIRTERLVLIPCDAGLLDAVMRERPLSGVVTHAEWPDDELRGAIPFLLAGLTADPSSVGWSVWLIVRDGVVVGSCGGHGAPGADGIVEIGFGVVPAMRRQGIAGEAVRGLMSWMRAQTAYRGAVARAAAGNEPSHRVLTAAGFVAGEIDGDLVVFRA